MIVFWHIVDYLFIVLVIFGLLVGFVSAVLGVCLLVGLPAVWIYEKLRGNHR